MVAPTYTITQIPIAAQYNSTASGDNLPTATTYPGAINSALGTDQGNLSYQGTGSNRAGKFQQAATYTSPALEGGGWDVSPTLNGTNGIFSFFVRHLGIGATDVIDNGGIRIAFRSGAGNWRTYFLSGTDYVAPSGISFRNNYIPVIINLEESGDISDIGTFNAAAIDRIEFLFSRINSGNYWLNVDQCRYVEDLAIIEGDSTTKATIKNTIASGLPDFFQTVGTSFYWASLPFSIGDGSNHLEFEDDFAIEFVNEYSSQTRFFRPGTKMGITLKGGNSGSSLIIRNSVVKGKDFNWISSLNSTTAVTLSNIFINGSGTTTLGQYYSQTGGAFIGREEIALNQGVLSNLTIRDSVGDAALTLTAAGSIDGLSIRDNTGAGVRIDIADAASTDLSNAVSNIRDNGTYDVLVQSTGASTGETYALDISGFTQPGANTTATPIYVNDSEATNTYNIVTGASYADSDADSEGATANIIAPSATFTSSQLVSGDFDNVRCRLSLTPGGAAGLDFENTDVDTDANTITITGINTKINANTVIRFSGDDLPQPLEKDVIYYPSSSYSSGNDLSVSGTVGGSAISLTDSGSGSMSATFFTELDIDLITSGDFVVDLSAAATNAGITLEVGDILCRQAQHWKGNPQSTTPAVASKYSEAFFQYQGSSIVDLGTLELDILHNLFSNVLETDGSLTAEFSFDASNPGKVQIEIDDGDAVTRTDRGYLFFVYSQWTESGMRMLRGQIQAISENELRVDGNLTLQALQKTRIRGPYIRRSDGEFLVADESEIIEWEFSNLIGYTIEQEVPVSLSGDVLQMIQTTLSMVSAMSLAESEGGGSGDSASAIYNYFTTSNRQNAFKADVSGLSTFDPSTDAVIVGTNNDKTGYSLTQTFPANFSSLAIDGSGNVTSGNMRGTDNALLAADYTASPSSSDIYTYFTDSNREDVFKADISELTTSIGNIPTNPVLTNDVRLNNLDATISSRSTFDNTNDSVIVVTNNDKTGYSLTQIFPANFASLGINASGHISRVTLVDTTTTNTDMRGTDSALLASNYTSPDNATISNISSAVSNLPLENDIYDYFSFDTRPNVFKADISTLSTLDTSDVSTVFTTLGYTSTRAGYLDKLNVTGVLANTDNADSFKADTVDIDSASIYTYFTSSNREDVFKADISNLSTLDSNEIASILTTQGYTATRASYLDKLNVTGTLAHSDDADRYKADAVIVDVSDITEALDFLTKWAVADEVIDQDAGEYIKYEAGTNNILVDKLNITKTGNRLEIRE